MPTPSPAVDAASNADQSTTKKKKAGDDQSCEYEEMDGGLRKYKDGSIRNSEGKFAGTTGKPPGTPAVDKAAAEVNSRPGWSVQGKEISVRNSEGTLRRYDLVAKNPEGKFVGIEVKGGSAAKTAQQRVFDEGLKSAGGYETVGQRAAKTGIDKINATELIKVP